MCTKEKQNQKPISKFTQFVESNMSEGNRVSH